LTIRGLLNLLQNKFNRFYYSIIYSFYSYNINILEAQNARNEYNTIKSEVDQLESSISSLKSTLDNDYGNNFQFYYLKLKCLNFDRPEYSYEICPYATSKQNIKSNSQQTNMGNQFSWVEKYNSFKFENGDSCWQGPNRSSTVKIICGQDDKIISQDEPSRCVYFFTMTSPSLCNEIDLTNLKNQLILNHHLQIQIHPQIISL